MRKLLPLAAVLFAIVGSHAVETIAAPVPKDTPPPSIDGKYNLVSVSNTPIDRVGKAGKAAAGFGTTRVTPATPDRPGHYHQERDRARRSPLPRQAVQACRPRKPRLSPRSVRTGRRRWNTPFDPAKMTIDIETENARGKKTKSLGVVEITGNRLIIAVAQPGGRNRPPDDRRGRGRDGGTTSRRRRPRPRVEFRIVAMRVGDEAEAEKELNKLAAAGYELVTTTTPAAVNDKASPTTVHFVLKRTMKQP